MTTLAHPYSFTAGTTITASEVNANNSATRTTVNGSLDGDNLTATVASQLGLSRSGVVSRGKTSIATEEVVNSVAYTTATTPDTVSGVVLPTDGLLMVSYRAMIKNSVVSAGSAAIFLGANQVKLATSAASPAVQEYAGPSNAGVYRPLAAGSGGIFMEDSVNAYTGAVTTGQIVGSATAGKDGFCLIEAAAGTYSVSIQFKATAGTVTVKERKLWVWTIGF